MPSFRFAEHLSFVNISGLAIKLGGCVAAWHNGYRVGVWGYFIACMVVAVGYSSLNLCVAELTSIIAFPGKLIKILVIGAHVLFLN